MSVYSDLFKAEDCDMNASNELLQGLPQLSSGERDTMSSDMSLEELTSEVTQMTSGKAPGSLPADFLKHFWSFIVHDLLDIIRESFEKGRKGNSYSIL